VSPARRTNWLRIVMVTTLSLVFLGCVIGIVVTGPIVVRPGKIEIDYGVSAERLRESVRLLATEFSPRDADHFANLDRAAGWIAESLAESGFEVEIQEYTLPEGTFRNVIGLKRGSDPALGATIVGAHYDAYGGFSGADDNASGVAALLELARTLPKAQPRESRYVVAFGTEEPPFFRTDGMGSYRFAKLMEERGVQVNLMIALDMVGYFSDEPGSQTVPFPGLGLLYPSKGDFIGVVGDLRAGPWIELVKRGILATESIPVHSFRAPTSVPGVDWSDHLSFRRLGMPAVLVTDTSFMRFPDYHTERDTPERLDYERMARVVIGLHGVLWEKPLPEED
jgi:Zn-dependent M28 family amino/carboxypeptidase